MKHNTLVLLALLPSTVAWLPSHQHQSPKTPTTRNRWQECKDTTQLRLPSKLYLEDSRIGSSLRRSSVATGSRREWLKQTAATAFATTAASILPPSTANAASLVSTTAVCDPGVSVWQKDGRLVYLLGTAHISSASAVLAGNLVQDIQPKGVFVELDPKRVKGSGILANRLKNGDDNSLEDNNATISKVIVPNIQVVPTVGASGGGSAAIMASSSLSSNNNATPSPPSKAPSRNPIMNAASKAVGNSIKGMYKKLDSAGFQAGEEFAVAIQEGQKIGSAIVLGDRDVEVTLQRVTEGLAKTDIKALLNPDSELEQSLKELVPSNMENVNPNDDLNLSDEEFRKEFSTFVETMKAKENVRKVMGQLELIAPALYQALVSERDAYMAAGLNGLDELETIVAVVGVAHVDGIEKNLEANGWKAALPTCAVKS